MGYLDWKFVKSNPIHPKSWKIYNLIQSINLQKTNSKCRVGFLKLVDWMHTLTSTSFLFRGVRMVIHSNNNMRALIQTISSRNSKRSINRYSLYQQSNYNTFCVDLNHKGTAQAYLKWFGLYKLLVLDVASVFLDCDC